MRSICEIADAVRSRMVSAIDVMEACLERIAARNGELNAFVFLDVEAARAGARAIDARILRGEDPGPLAGVPFGVKDLDHCAGMPTTYGSVLFRDAPRAKIDSPDVARARAAGAIPVGKTAVPDFGLHSVTSSSLFGVTRNPIDPTKSPGGSSGGSSAAVAARLVPLATGTDAGGSIRSPAAFTGLVGLKPSYGRIGRERATDATVQGCLTTTARDTARYLDVVAGPTASDRSSLPARNGSEPYERLIETLPVAGLTAAWSDDLGFAPTEPECIAVAREAAEMLAQAAGLRWVGHRFSVPNTATAWSTAVLLPFLGELERDGIWPDRSAELAPRARERLAALGSPTLLDIAVGIRAREELERTTAEFFETVDLLCTPATTVVALPAEGPIPLEIAGRDARHTGAEAHLQLANLTGQPAIAVPAGRSATGFPIGLQIICRRWRDDVALRLAHLFEQGIGNGPS
jgi:aspartyl-tRNA(Asn)/glutamyl-tRNA(Gln) amidotransferase subunit A